MTVRVDVTDDDIRQGGAGDTGVCPIALALHRCAPWSAAFVVQDWCAFGDFEADLPPAAQDFIASFDAGLPVAPFVFQLYLEG